MAKINLNDVASGYNRSKINQNFTDLEFELNNKVLYRDNPTGEPNQMEVALDMNSNPINNLPIATQDQQAISKIQMEKYINANASGLIANLREEFTATPGQTVFTLNSFVYTTGVNNVSVYVNGVRQPQSSYEETSGSTITLSESMEGGELVEVTTNDVTDTTITVPADIVTYDNSTSGLTATSAQAAIDEVEGRLDNVGDETITTGTGTQTIEEGMDDRWISKYTTDQLSTATSLRAGNKVRTTGKTAGGDGGISDYLIEERDGTSNDGFLNIFITGTDLQAKFLRGTAISDVTVLIPSQYPDLQSAVDFLYESLEVKNSHNINLTIESGHVVTSGLSVFDGNFSKFRVISSDAEVLVESLSDLESIIFGSNAALPTLGTVFNAQGTTGRNGYWASSGSTGIVESGCGIKNLAGTGSGSTTATGAGIFVSNSSNLVATGCVSTGNKRNLWVTKNSGIEAEFSDFSGCLGDFACFISRTSRAHLQGSDLTNSTGSGLGAYTSLVRCHEVDVTNCAQAGIISDNSSVVSATELIADSTGGSTCISRDGSTLDISNASVSNCGFDSVVVEGNSRCTANDASITLSGRRGVSVSASSSISLLNATVSGSDDRDIYVLSGSNISATGATTTEGAIDVLDCNVFDFNSLSGSNGIIWV